MIPFNFLAVDLDGTLLRNDSSISDFSADTLIHSQKNGLKVAICTGRPTDGARHIAQRIRLHEFGGYIVGYNGGEIIECATGNVVRDLILPDGVLPQIVEFARQMNAEIMTFCNRNIISTSDSHPVIIRSSRRNRMDIMTTDNWRKEVEGLKLHKCMFVGEPEILRANERNVKDMFEGVLSAFCSEPHFLELNPLGVNKGDGLRWLLNYADVDPASVIAFGDTPSDIPMIRMAGKGVAMGNAPQAVKDVADAVALSNEEDGVAQMLQSMY